MKAVLFDLDDTLYPEIEFVKSGFRTVARHLGLQYGLDEDYLIKQMLHFLHRDGRGRVFDSLLHALGLYTTETVRLLVYLYRSHHPDIQLHDDVRPVLEYLRCQNIRRGMVTDGMASVQKSKITALDLVKLFDTIVCTDEVGADYGKPSTVAYTVALKLLDVSSPEAVYVGDDPIKDFPGPNSMGMLTIQIRRQNQHKRVPDTVPEMASARYVVANLEEIIPIIEEQPNAC